MKPTGLLRTMVQNRYHFIIIMGAVLALLVLLGATAASAQNTGSLAGRECPDWVHNLWVTMGPDGKTYPTWHPPVDPTYGCYFTHEHGADPRQFVGFPSTGMPAFGYTGNMAAVVDPGAAQDPHHGTVIQNTAEPHEGFKVYVTNDDLNGRAWMLVFHMGSRNPRRAFVQFHALDIYIYTQSGQKLVEVRRMADFGYASPNCTAPGNPIPGSTVAFPGSASGYAFSQYQPQRRFVPTTDCATTRVYENWNFVYNVAGVFSAQGSFDIDNASTVLNVNNPTEIRYMCEFQSPGEDCASFWNTQWSGNKRALIGFTQRVNNTGPTEFYTDPYGQLVSAGTPGAIKQFVANTSWRTVPCYCNRDVFKSYADYTYHGDPDGNDPAFMNDGFPVGAWALTYKFQAPSGPIPQPPPPVTPAPSQTPDPTPDPSPTPEPAGPTLIVEVDPASASAGQMVNVHLKLVNVQNVYGLQTQCMVDPAVLTGTQRQDGVVFNQSNSFFVDKGFQPDGKWTTGVSLLQPSVPFSGSGIAYGLYYTVAGAGSSSVTCTALAVDKDGKELPLTVMNGSFNGAVVTTPPPTEPPTATPEPTELPTLTPPPTLTTITGKMAYQNGPDNANITVQLITNSTVLATITTGADGMYTFTDVAPGVYGITAIGMHHLRIGKMVTVTESGQVIDLGTLILPGGDTDNNGIIDLVDAALVGANFDLPVNPAPANADINMDGLINIRDLAIIGGNFNLAAPVILQ